MSSRQSARLAGKSRRKYKDTVQSLDRNSDSDSVAQHRNGRKAPARDSDFDDSHGEGSRPKRPRQTKKRKVEVKVPRQQEMQSSSTSGAHQRTREKVQVILLEPIPSPKPLKHARNQDDPTDLSEPPDTPTWTESEFRQRCQPSKLGDRSDCDDSALPYASCRRKESLECLNFVNHVLIEHSLSQNSTDCVVVSSQLHERDEALLFENYKDGSNAESPQEKGLTEHVGAAQHSPYLEEVSLPDVRNGIRSTARDTLSLSPFQIDFEAFDWDVEPENEVAPNRENLNEIKLAAMPDLGNGDSCGTDDRGYHTAEEQSQGTPSPEPPAVSEAKCDAAEPVREIDGSTLNHKRRHLDAQLAEYQRQEAAKADLLTMTEGADSSDDDDLAELLSKMKPRNKAPIVRRELGPRHPVKAKSSTAPAAVLKSKEIEALRKVEVKERMRAQAIEYSRLDDEKDTLATSDLSFEPSRHAFAPRLGEEFQDLRDLLGVHVSQQTDVHLSIWRQLLAADVDQGPIFDIRQALFGRVPIQQIRGKSFADWQDEIYQCTDNLCADRAAAETLVVPLIGASFDLPLYGLGLIRRAVGPGLSSLDLSKRKDMLQHLAELMKDQDSEHFDAHVFGMLDGQRPFLSWLSLKLLHPGLEPGKIELATEPPADLLLSLMESEQIDLNRVSSLSQLGDDYRSLRRQSRQLASHWHDLSILFHGYQTTTIRRQTLKEWHRRAESILSELLRWVVTRADESFNPKRAQVRETLSLLQSRIQRQIDDLLTYRGADISGGPVEIEDLLKTSLKYHPPEDFAETNSTFHHKQPKPKQKKSRIIYEHYEGVEDHHSFFKTITFPPL